jgi:hypothetical protein
MREQTEAEGRLLTFIIETFGEQLGSLLLSGYCELVKAGARRFVISLPAEAQKKKRRRYLKIGTTLRLPLPYGQDPLVLSALIKLLLHDGRQNNRSVIYTHSDLLRLLEWPDCSESRLVIDYAVARYFNLYYQPVETLAELTGKSPVYYTYQERLISEYGSASRSEAGGQPLNGTICLVKFNLPFIEQLKRKSLFNIDWECVQSLTRLPSKTRR